VSQTQILVDQIKQISIKICDIKEKTRIKSKSKRSTNTHNHILNDPPPLCGEGCDEDNVHYEDNIQSNHLSPHNRNNQKCYVPTPPLPEEESSACWSLLLPNHQIELRQRNPPTPSPMILPWSTSSTDSESKETKEGNVSKESSPIMNGMMPS